MLTLAYAPFSHWWITPISLLAVFWIFLTRPVKGFYFGLSFGLGWFGAGISWVHVSIANFGGLPLVGSVSLMLLLCGYLALFPALFFQLLSRYRHHCFIAIAAIPLWWTTEWLRSWFLTGFPWLSLGYSQIDGPLSGLLPIVGESGVSVILLTSVLCAAKSLSIGRLRQSKRLIAATLTPFIIGHLLTQVQWVTSAEQSANITMIQGNIKQELRWTPEQDQPTMDKYLNLTAPYWDSDIIIWPEAAVPKLEPLAQGFLYQLDKQALNTNTGLVTGIVNYNFETSQAFNNLITLGKSVSNSDNTDSNYHYLHPNRYAKHHLLPIGEFIPMESWLRGLAPIFDLPMSSFTRGDFQQTNLLVNGWKLAPAICFEIAFPRQILANIQSDTDFIITVSNDAWFGRSHGPAQHLEIARMRALELGIPVLRATNTGITAFIDHSGEVVSQAPQFEDAALSHSLTTSVGTTPYRYWGDALNWFIVIVCAAFMLFRLKKEGSLARQ